MPLSGVNAVCRKCIQKCKQWEQITVVKCPNYVYNGKLGGLPSTTKRKRSPTINDL